MKKLITILLAMLLSVVCLFSFGCDENQKTVGDSGKIIVGVTDYAPMDYLEDGKWVVYVEEGTPGAEKDENGKWYREATSTTETVSYDIKVTKTQITQEYYEAETELSSEENTEIRWDN